MFIGSLCGSKIPEFPIFLSVESRKNVKFGSCCNPTDHIGLPIIHINTDIHNRDKREEQVSRITYYIIVKGSIQYRELNRVLIWLNNLIYMNYKQLQITTCRFGEPTWLLVSRLIFLVSRSTDLVGWSTSRPIDLVGWLSWSSFKSTYVDLLLLQVAPLFFCVKGALLT